LSDHDIVGIDADSFAASGIFFSKLTWLPMRQRQSVQ
jgi:hypothetical protein